MILTSRIHRADIEHWSVNDVYAISVNVTSRFIDLMSMAQHNITEALSTYCATRNGMRRVSSSRKAFGMIATATDREDGSLSMPCQTLITTAVLARINVHIAVTSYTSRPFVDDEHFRSFVRFRYSCQYLMYPMSLLLLLQVMHWDYIDSIYDKSLINIFTIFSSIIDSICFLFFSGAGGGGIMITRVVRQSKR